MGGDRSEYFGEQFIDFRQVPLVFARNQLVQVINKLDVVPGLLLVHCSNETRLLLIENLRYLFDLEVFLLCQLDFMLFVALLLQGQHSSNKLIADF